MWGRNERRSGRKTRPGEASACQNSHEEHDWIDLPGVEKLQVMRTGKSKGGGRGTHFEFLLNHHGIEFLLANRRTVSTKMPNAWLRLTGEMCLLIGAAEGRAHFRSLIESLGGKVAYEKISRIDLTLDIAGVPIQAFYEPFQNGQFISAGRKDDFHRENQELTGFSRGRSPCRIEFYDKLRKTLQGVDTNVIDAMVHRRRGGRFPAAATT